MSNKPIKQTVKDTIDYVYELLSTNPSGYELNVSGLGFNAACCCAILVKRGIISKERKYINGQLHVIYKWVANMPPSKVLYGSVSDELKSEQSKRKRRVAPPKSNANDKESIAPAFTPVNLSMDCFSEQELWDELKRRGATIKDGKLMIVKAVELL